MKNRKFFSYASVFLSFIIFGYIIIIHFLNFLFPDLAIFASWVIKMPELRFLFSFIFVLSVLGIFWEQKSLKKIFKFPQSKKETSLYFISAFSMAYFYRGSFSLLGRFPTLSLLVLTVFFFFFLPSLVEFYLCYDPFFLLVKINRRFKQFKRKLAIDMELNVKSNLKLVGKSVKDFKSNGRLFLVFLFQFRKAVILFFLLMLAFIFIIGSGWSYLSLVREIRSSFYIKSVTPIKNIYGEKVVIRGYNFDWKDSGQYKLMSNQGPIVTHLWTGNQIVFIVPLHLKQNTTVKLWLVKPKNGWLVRSNQVNFTILDRMKFYPVVEDSWKVRMIKKIKKLFLLDNKYLNRLL